MFICYIMTCTQGMSLLLLLFTGYFTSADIAQHKCTDVRIQGAYSKGFQNAYRYFNKSCEYLLNGNSNVQVNKCIFACTEVLAGSFVGRYRLKL